MMASVQPRYVRDRFTWMSFFLLGHFAFLEAALGPIMPFLRSELKLDYRYAGLHLSALALGSMLDGLYADRIVQRWGRPLVFWMGSAGMAFGTLLLALGRRAEVTIASTFIMGLFGGLLLITLQAALSDRHGPNRTAAIGEANVMASFATSISALLIGWFAAWGIGWRSALYFITALWAVVALWYRNEPVPPMDDPPPPDPGTKSPRRVLPLLFWVYLLAMMLMVSVEWCMAGWSADYMNSVLGLEKDLAAGLMMVFFSAMMIGRFAGSRLARTIRSEALIFTSILIALVGFPLFWLAPALPLNILGLFLTGLGTANFYPITLALAVGTAAERADAASSRTSVGVGAAIMSMPQIMAWIADQTGIRTAFSIVLIVLILMIVVMLFANRLATRHNQAPLATGSNRK